MAPAKARRILDRYVLEQPIGRGGMGVVWKAEDTLLARSVAIKEVQLPPVLPGEREQLRQRVMREARAAARLSHHGVVTLYDVVRDEGRTYIVMELVEARTLADIVRQQGPLSPRQAADVGRRVLDALQAAHRRGIVHRDVKPGNVMVLADGRTKLADFGIASLSGDPELTATGTVLGSPSYMAPEQANGEPSGPASDLYALGATLYFAVEGEPPFSKGAALPTLTAVVHEQARPMRQAGPLAPVITALLAKSPEDRPAGDELIEMLDAVAEERGTFGQQLSASLSRPPWRRGRRRPWPRPDIEADAGVTAIQPTDDLPSVDAPTAAAEAPPAPTARIDTPAKEAARPAKERAPEAPPAPAEDDPPTPAAEAPTTAATKPATTAPQRRTRKVTSKRQPARPATSTPAASTKAAPAKPAAAGAVAEGAVAEGAGTPAAQAAAQPPATGVTEPASKPPPAPPEPKPEPKPAAKPEPRPAPTAKTPATKKPATKTPDTRTPATRTPGTRTPATKAPAGPGTSSAGAWSRRRVAVLVGVVLVVAVLVGGWLALANRGGSPEGLAATDTTSQTVAGGATGTTAAPTTTAATSAPTTAPPTSAVAGAAPPPAGWETFRNGQAGYAAAHPAGWQVVRRQGRAIDLVKPNSGTYLRVDWTPTPGPSALGAWRDYEPGFASGKRGYKRIRMEKTDYRGLDAAIWEYSYTEGSTRLHAVNLGFVASDQRAYALNFQTRETDWAAEQPTFESVKRSFAFGT